MRWCDPECVHLEGQNCTYRIMVNGNWTEIFEEGNRIWQGEVEQRMKRRKISYRRQDCCGTDGWTDIDGKCRPKAVQGRIVIWQLLKERVFSVTTSLSINFQNILIWILQKILIWILKQSLFPTASKVINFSIHAEMPRIGHRQSDGISCLSPLSMSTLFSYHEYVVNPSRI